MKRILALWLPNWPVQRLLSSRPELAGQPIILERPSRRGQCVAACSREACEAGVCVGMPIAEAVVLLSPVPSPSWGGLGRGANPVHASTPSLNPSPQGGGGQSIQAFDSQADRLALEQLAQWCHRYSPTAGLEESEAPETILLDATNLAPLYGSEESLVVQVLQGVRRLGFEARAALAGALGAAWALAHYSNWDESATAGSSSSAEACTSDPLLDKPAVAHISQLTVVPSDQTRAALAPLPIAALRLSDELLETLRNLGAERIDDLLALPRDQLRSRFGPLLLTRLDQALGAAREVFAAAEPPEEFVVEQLFEYPLAERDALHHVIENLLERLSWMLKARSAGALRVACRFDCEGAPCAELEVGLFQPTANPRRLLEIVELEMERLRLPAPATAISIRALRHAPLEQRQGVLFDQERSLESSLQLAALVDRLASRLGRHAVLRCRLQRDAQPELAYAEDPLVSHDPPPLKGWEQPSTGDPKSPERRAAVFCEAIRGGIKKRRRKNNVRGATTVKNPSPLPSLRGRGVLLAPLDRPLYLLRRPAALETVSVVPDGPPIQFRRSGRWHVIARNWGPERIETGWWRGQSAWRDYYRVETTEGHRYWLFRRRRDGRWFLHGIFG